MTRVRDLVSYMETLAPHNYAEEWDNVGLQVGKLDNEVKKVFLALTPSEKVLRNAQAKKADMIITHHPLFFKGIKHLSDELPLGKMVYTLIEQKMTLYSAHTNLDVAPGGVNDILGEYLGVDNMAVLKETYREKMYKMVVFVPSTHIMQVKEALFDEGAGNLGNYSECSWQVSGEMTYKANTFAKPFLGKREERYHTDEYRLEVLVRGSLLSKVIEVLNLVHPYENIAYDIFEQAHLGISYGLGRIGKLKQPMNFSNYVQTLVEKFNLEKVKVVGEDKKIETVAFCGGSGAEFIRLAKSRGADCYLTGDLKYHDGQLAEELGLNLVDLTHFASEKIVMHGLKRKLEGKFLDIDVYIDEEENDFFYWL